MKKSYHLLIFFSLLFVAAFLLLIPGAEEAVFQNPEIDTIGHFIGFIVFTWLVHIFLQLPLVTLTVALVFYSAASEIGQYYLGFRNGEFTDFLANVAGIFTYLGMRWVLFLYKHK